MLVVVSGGCLVLQSLYLSLLFLLLYKQSPLSHCSSGQEMMIAATCDDTIQSLPPYGQSLPHTLPILLHKHLQPRVNLNFSEAPHNAYIKYCDVEMLFWRLWNTWMLQYLTSACVQCNQVIISCNILYTGLFSTHVIFAFLHWQTVFPHFKFAQT